MAVDSMVVTWWIVVLCEVHLFVYILPLCLLSMSAGKTYRIWNTDYNEWNCNRVSPNTIHTIQLFSGITSGRVLNDELYAQILQKLI